MLYRLQKELDASKNCPDEQECISLRKELEELQRQCYHKQMQQQLQHSEDVYMHSQSTGHYNPYTHRYVPVASSLRSTNTSLCDTNQESIDGSDEDDANCFVDAELLTENCLDMFVNCEDGCDVASTKENTGTSSTDNVSVNLLTHDNTFVSERQSSTQVPQIPKTVADSRIKKQLPHSHQHQLSSNVSSLLCTNANVPSSRGIIISPEPGNTSRKRPGQSIYKAPGTQHMSLRCVINVKL